MDADYVVEVTNQALKITMMLSAPMLIGALLIGIVISLFQAVTQINEQTLTFIPKILVVIAALVIFSPWMRDIMVDYTRTLILMIPQIVTQR